MVDNIYWHEALMRNEGAVPSILAIGDSWFWYPLPGGSLATSLARLLVPRAHTVLAFGNNGAEAFDYIDGVYAPVIASALERYGTGCSAVFVSGGGNDFAGFTDLRPLLDVDCSARTTEEACFTGGAGPHPVHALFDRVKQSYIALIDLVAAHVPASARIYVHNYDYALPSGKPVIGGKAWLKPALVAAQVPVPLRAGCVRYLIDQFSLRLSDLETRYAGRVVFVDSRGILSDADWANELHPKATGFGKIARRAWKPALQAAGLL